MGFFNFFKGSERATPLAPFKTPDELKKKLGEKAGEIDYETPSITFSEAEQEAKRAEGLTSVDIEALKKKAAAKIRLEGNDTMH